MDVMNKVKSFISITFRTEKTSKKRCFLKTAAAKNLKAIKKIAKGDNYLQHSEKMLQF